MSGRATAIFVGAPLTNNTCEQSPISKTRPDRDIMVNRSDMISLVISHQSVNSQQPTVNSQQSTVNSQQLTVNS
ncbi:hypothetical protein Q5692_13275 [Microcoleus sp. C2C3]|uniref:hypothetical protein n=1 Tax=unclassified Microcoleus TaxID=2642155 RepID=UPI002FD23984